MWAVKKRWRAGNDQIQPWITASVDFINPLPQGIESLLTRVSTHALQSFHLVQHQYETRKSTVSQYREQADQEITGSKMVQIALDTSRTLDAGSHVGLPSQPADQALRQHAIVVGQSLSIGTQHRRERWSRLADRAETCFHQRIRPLQQHLRIISVHRRIGQHILLQRVKPTVDHVSERATGHIRCAQVLDKPPVDRFQPMKRGLGFVDLNFGCGKTSRPRTLLQPTPKESFPGAIFTSHCLEAASAGGH